jgi:hypothetical protein
MTTTGRVAAYIRMAPMRRTVIVGKQGKQIRCLITASRAPPKPATRMTIAAADAPRDPTRAMKRLHPNLSATEVPLST